MSDIQKNKCIVCGKKIYGNSTAYCEEHKYLAERDDKIIQEAPMELLFSLIAGIFIRARADYMLNSDNQRTDAEVFLRSSWAQTLSLSEFDADEVIKQMDEEIKHGVDWLRGDTGRKKWQ